MEKGKSNRTNKDRKAGNADALETLFRQVSSRPEPSRQVREGVRSAVHGEWRAVTARRHWRRRTIGLAAAASVALVFTVLVLNATRQSPSTDLREMARVERVIGHVRVLANQTAERGAALALQTPVYQGQSLRTGEDSGIALRLPGGTSLRLDQNSELRLLDVRTVALDSGRVYVDSQTRASENGLAEVASPGLAVVTTRGVVRHLGTQYMVRVAESGLRVSVREGRVAFESGDSKSAPLFVSGGEELAFDGQGGPALITSDPDGEQWLWAEQLGAGFVMEGRPMAEFLEWVAGETGTEVVYLSGEAKGVATRTKLHGTVDLPPRRALELVVPTSDLSAEFRNGTIEVKLKR